MTIAQILPQEALMVEERSGPAVGSDREATAKRIFPEYTTMSPEEWAARFAHTIGASPFGDYAYQDPVLHPWIHRLHEILLTPGAIERYQLQYLSPSECTAIEEEEDDL